MAESSTLSLHASDPEEDLMATLQSMPNVATVSGPHKGMLGYQSSCDQSASIQLPLTVQKKGYIAFWFMLDRDYRSGPQAEHVVVPILSGGGAFKVELQSLPRQVELIWDWQDPNLLVNQLRIILPCFPGGEWLHFAVSWDSVAGIFDGWLNGTSLREEGTVVPSWQQTKPISALELNLTTRIALAGLHVADTAPDSNEMATTLGAFNGSLSNLLGAEDKGTVEWEGQKGELIYSDTLGCADCMQDWVAEGPLEATFAEGFMQMRSKLPDDLRKGHTVLWLKTELPHSFLAEWEMKPISDRGLCIVFFAAQGFKGESIFSEHLQKRDGDFPLYHSGDINCYHISYYANTPETPGRLTSNLRKNHGFYLVTNGPPGISAHSRAWHKIQLLKRGARVQLAVDGRCVIDYTDDGKSYGPVWQEGAFGLRQMVWTVGGYRNISIHQLVM